MTEYRKQKITRLDSIRSSDETPMKSEALLNSMTGLNTYKSSVFRVDRDNNNLHSTMHSKRDKSYTDDCYSTIDRDTTIHAGRESSTHISSIKEEKASSRKSSKTSSKAQLYTPRLKMSFCKSGQITPVLREKKATSQRKLKFTANKCKLNILNFPNYNCPFH